MRMDIVAVVLAFIFSISIMLTGYHKARYSFYNPTVIEWIELEKEIDEGSGDYCIVSFYHDLSYRGNCTCRFYTYRILPNNTLIKICKD